MSTVNSYRDQFRTSLGPLYTLIRKAGKQGGKLSVSIPIASSGIRQEIFGRQGGSDYQIEIVAMVDGKEFYNNSFDASNELSRILSFFNHHHLASEDDYLNLIAELEGDRPRLSALARDYRKNVAGTAKLHERLEGAVRFFSRGNLEGLKRYGSHKWADVPFSVRVEGDRVSFKLADQSRPTVFALGSALEVPVISLPS